MSLTGIIAETAEQTIMLAGLAAEMPAITAKTGVAASPSRPAASIAGLASDLTWFVAANVPIPLALSSHAPFPACVMKGYARRCAGWELQS